MSVIPKEDRFYYTISHTDKICKGPGSNFRFCLDSEDTDRMSSKVNLLANIIENKSQAYASVQGSLVIRDTMGKRALPTQGYKDRMPKKVVLSSSDEGMSHIRVKIPVPGFAPVMQTGEGNEGKVDTAATAAKFQTLCDSIAALGLHDAESGALLDVVVSGAGRMLDEFREDTSATEQTP